MDFTSNPYMNQLVTDALAGKYNAEQLDALANMISAFGDLTWFPDLQKRFALTCGYLMIMKYKINQDYESKLPRVPTEEELSNLKEEDVPSWDMITKYYNEMLLV